MIHNKKKDDGIRYIVDWEKVSDTWAATAILSAYFEIARNARNQAKKGIEYNDSEYYSARNSARICREMIRTLGRRVKR